MNEEEIQKGTPPGSSDDVADKDASPPATGGDEGRQPRSPSRLWEAVVGVSTAAGVIVALAVGLPNVLSDRPAGSDRPPASAPSTSPPAPSPSPPPPLMILTPTSTDGATVKCVKDACAVEVRGRTRAAPGLHSYVLIARECCPGDAPRYYVQWDSTKEVPGGDWVALAYVQKPPVNATFQIKAILTTSAVRATPGADDLVVWSDDMAKAVGLVAETPTVTVKVTGVVQATAFCDCS
ncbi:hypothetical protein [Micromonospora antibiotica]|uniref:Uncharacterized protein n=1 Tax=Micromonospora antibiotica TaxID=2807623 RepID=A0ABS3V6E6_9ACTN|nr:hypothetical protein [Micromonospora antibiotica]MBO4161198.1 hypothetical protein [Micromonospora antibiotica]